MRSLKGRIARVARGAARLACAMALVTGLAVPAAPGSSADMLLLARDDFAPWSARDWPEQGLVTALLRAALAQRASDAPALDWRMQPTAVKVPDQEAAPGLAFPVADAGCAGQAPPEVCRAYVFSDPVIDVATLLFVPAESAFRYESEADLAGAKLCRPEGHGTDDLRDLAARVDVQLVMPADISDCFEAVLEGRADAVAVDEFHAVVKLFELGLTEAIVPLPKPLSIYSLHVTAPKDHWLSTAHIARVNDGLARLHQSGAYAAIIDRYLQRFWAEVRARKP